MLQIRTGVRHLSKFRQNIWIEGTPMRGMYSVYIWCCKDPDFRTSKGALTFSFRRRYQESGKGNYCGGIVTPPWRVGLVPCACANMRADYIGLGRKYASETLDQMCIRYLEGAIEYSSSLYVDPLGPLGPSAPVISAFSSGIVRVSCDCRVDWFFLAFPLK